MGINLPIQLQIEIRGCGQWVVCMCVSWFVHTYGFTVICND